MNGTKQRVETLTQNQIEVSDRYQRFKLRIKSYLSTVPGTPQYIDQLKKEFYIHVLRATRYRVKLFNSLEGIDEVTKCQHLPIIRRSSANLARLEYWQLTIFNRLVQLSLYVLASLIFAIVIFPSLLSHTREATIRFLFTFAAPSFVLLVTFLILRLVHSKKRFNAFEHKNAIVFILFRVITVAGSGSIFYLWALKYKSHVAQIIGYLMPSAVLWSFAVPFIILVFDAMLNLLIKKTFYTLKLVRCPEDLIIDNLIHIMHTLGLPHVNWIKLSAKRANLIRLEEISICIQRGIPIRLRSNDANTDRWTKSEAMRISAPFRDLKKWLINPMYDTRYQLREVLASTLLYIMDGNWSGLRRLEPEKDYFNLMWKTRILQVAHSVFISAVPILMLLIVQSMHLTPTGADKTPLQVGAIAISAVLLLRSFDPNFSATVSAIKDTIQSFTLQNKDKKL